MLERLQSSLERLTARERALVGIMGSVFIVLMIAIPVLLLNQSIAEIESDNEAIVDALRQIERAQGRLNQERAQRLASDTRYGNRPPSLGSFLEAKVNELEGMTISDVQHEPDRVVDGFEIHHSRARFQGTGLRNAMLLIQNIENSRYPLSLERIHIDHSPPTGDRYNVQLGVLAFEREGAGDAAPPSPEQPARRRAGPPAP